MGHRFILAIVIVLVMCVFSGNTLAQPKAHKFRELLLGWGTASSAAMDWQADEKELKLHLAQYVKQLRRENANAYIIGYGPRVVEWTQSNLPLGQANASWVRSWLWDYFPSQRITAIDGGYREKAVTELWIVPRGASPPTPTPAVDSKDVVHCPYLFIDGPKYIPNPRSILTFSVRLSSNDPTVKPSLTWETSQGTISGQGTKTISVEVPESMSGELVTKITANGYSQDCPGRTTTAKFKTIVGVGSFKFDEYGQICEDDEKARLDFFSMQLKDPDLVAYIVFYGGRCYSSCEIDYPRHRPHYPRVGEAEQRAARIKPYLVNTRGIDENRIFVVNGGFRESWTAELWLAPKGSPPPPLTPTTNATDIRYRTGKITERELVTGCMGTKR